MFTGREQAGMRNSRERVELYAELDRIVRVEVIRTEQQLQRRPSPVRRSVLVAGVFFAVIVYGIVSSI
jgi:hypothetical protein